MRLLPHRARLVRILDATKARFGITVYRFSVNSNHLHFVIRGRRRRAIQNFLRAFAGLVARAMTGARRAGAVGKFWDVPVFSRIVDWGRAFRAALGYVRRNQLEAAGRIAYRPRAKSLPRSSPRRTSRGVRSAPFSP